MIKLFRYSFFILLLIWDVSNSDAQSLRPADLRTQYSENPLGIDEKQPGFSWKLQSQPGERGKEQTAYRILVASDEALLARKEGDIWDSGKINSDETIQIPYDGPALRSSKRYYWSVSVWDQDGRQSEYSDTAWFETGLFGTEDWKAVWISALSGHDGVLNPEQIPEPLPAPHFRKGFRMEKNVTSARLYISGLGYYKAFLNGQRIGNHILDPAVTRYDKTVLYETYDVTKMVREGRNALGVILGTGWYNFHALAAWDFDHAPWRAQPALKAQLILTFKDGSKQIIKTDRSWKVRTGPIVFDGIHNGETYDARLELNGWASPDADSDGWQQAFEVLGPDEIPNYASNPPHTKFRGRICE
ncbi:MAG: hypothetical protein GVY07_16575 [Bacteroidetes bacterium]|jgi:alpha-L-rhamnosidase|nr:hypothetical protein [Bacteroidota bacterium]